MFASFHVAELQDSTPLRTEQDPVAWFPSGRDFQATTGREAGRI